MPDTDTKDAPAGETSRAFATRTLGVDLQARTVKAYITTPDLDADGDVVLPRGADLSRFKKNPAVFEVHNYGAKNLVGRVESLKMEDDGIVATVRFTPRPPTLPPEEEWLPDTLLWMYHVGDLKGWSIGFAIKDARNPTKADREKYGDDLKRVITRWLMCELSVAPLPANPSALTLSLKGLISPRLAEVLAAGRTPTLAELPDAEGKSYDDMDDQPDETDPMPVCPVCKDDGDVAWAEDAPTETRSYFCRKCGTRMNLAGEAMPTADETKKSAAGGVKLNSAGAAHARALAEAGKVDHGSWDESSVERSKANGDSFLGIDTSHPDTEAGHWKFPVCADGRVNRKALGTAAGYAEKNGYTSIANAAKSIGDLIDRRDAGTAKAVFAIEGPPAADPVLLGIPPGPPPTPDTILVGVPPAPPEPSDEVLVGIPPAPEPQPEPEPQSLLVGIPPAEPERVVVQAPPEPPESRLIELPELPADAPPATPETRVIELPEDAGPKSVLIELPQPQPQEVRTVVFFLPPPEVEETKASTPDFGRVVAATAAMVLAKKRGRLFV